MPSHFTHIDPSQAVPFRPISHQVEGIYVLNPKRVAYCAQPINWIGHAAIACIIIGIVAASFQVDIRILISITAALSVFGGFYVFGYAMLYRFMRRERSKSIELEYDTNLIHYQSSEKKLLFRKEQVLLSEWNRSLLFPYRVDEVILHLEGGEEIRCSNLLINSKDLLFWLKAPIVSRYRWMI